MLPLFNLVDAVGIEPTMFLMYWILSPVRLSQLRHASLPIIRFLDTVSNGGNRTHNFDFTDRCLNLLTTQDICCMCLNQVTGLELVFLAWKASTLAN